MRGSGYMDRRNLWSKEEEEYLKKNSKMSEKQLALKLEKSQEAIRAKRQSLRENINKKNLIYNQNKGKGWSEDEIKYLRDHPNMSTKQLAEALGRSPGSVRTKKYALGNDLSANSTTPKANKDWSKRELDYLTENKSLPRKELAEHLNRSVQSVAMQLARIRGSSLIKTFDEDENSKLKELYKKNKSDKQISHELSINPNTVRKQRYSMGLIRINDEKYKGNDTAVDLRNMSTTDKQVIKGFLGNLTGLKRLGRELKKSPNSLKPVIQDLGVKSVKQDDWTSLRNHLKEKFNHILPIHLQEILKGMLLADGRFEVQNNGIVVPNTHGLKEYQNAIKELNDIRSQIISGTIPTLNDIRKWNNGADKIINSNIATFRVNKSIQEFTWVNELYNEFKQYCNNLPKIAPNNKTNQILKWDVNFETTPSAQFGFEWDKWYEPLNIKNPLTEKFGQKYKKILPLDFKDFTPNSLLHMYSGIGSMSANSIYFASMNFTQTENKILQTELKKIEIQSELVRTKYGNGYYVGISMNQDNRKNFFDYISQARMYSKAEEFLPYKFDRSLSREEYLNEVLKDHPEFTDPNCEITWNGLFSSNYKK